MEPLPIPELRDGPVRVSIRPDLLHLAIDRPERQNALNSDMLCSLLRQLDRHRDQRRVLVLSGGEHAFSIGSDIRELAAMSGRQAESYSLLCQAVITRLESWPRLTIAACRGYVIGAALELILGCDQICAGPRAQFGMPGLAYALLPVMGGVRRLGARCSPTLARRVFLGGEIINRAQAIACHLVQRPFACDSDLERVLVEAHEWSPSAVQAIRDLRLRDYCMSDARQVATTFAQGFYSGECQRRLLSLMAE